MTSWLESDDVVIPLISGTGSYANLSWKHDTAIAGQGNGLVKKFRLWQTNTGTWHGSNVHGLEFRWDSTNSVTVIDVNPIFASTQQTSNPFFVNVNNSSLSSSGTANITSSTDHVRLWNDLGTMIADFTVGNFMFGSSGSSGSGPTISYMDATLFTQISGGSVHTWNGVIHTNDTITHSDFTLTKNSTSYPNTRVSFQPATFSLNTGGTADGYKYRIIHTETGTYGVSIGTQSVTASLTGVTPALSTTGSNRVTRWLDKVFALPGIPALSDNGFTNFLAENFTLPGLSEVESAITSVFKLDVLIPPSISDTSKDYILVPPVGFIPEVWVPPVQVPDGVTDTELSIELDDEVEGVVSVVENPGQFDEVIIDTITIKLGSRKVSNNFW